MPSKISKYAVEFVGTLLLSFIIFATGNFLAIGAALAIAVALGGHLSGGAFNPAIALAMIYGGNISRDDFVPYVIAEIAGAVLGYELVRAL